jgi:N-methylhydantoinase A/oxoprolinase/acetone carboxylase beta subunit
VHSAAIDFGGTVTDLVLRRAGQSDVLLAVPTVVPEPAVALELIARLLTSAGETPDSQIDVIAVTGGRS